MDSLHSDRPTCPWRGGARLLEVEREVELDVDAGLVLLADRHAPPSTVGGHGSAKPDAAVPEQTQRKQGGYFKVLLHAQLTIVLHVL